MKGRAREELTSRLAHTMSFGAEMTRLMQANGVGVNELARKSGYTASHISQLRSGKRNPSPRAAQDLDDALQADGVLAELVPAETSGPLASGGSVNHSEAAGSDLSRHDFLMLATTAASLLDMLGTRPFAVSSGRTRVDTEAVEGLTQVLLGYRMLYRSAGAAALLAPVCGTLSLLAEIAPAAGPYGEVIVSLIGQAAGLAGTILMLDQGDFPGAARYLAVAARAAQQSGDEELLAILFACRAFHAAYSDDPHDGAAFADEALRIADRAAIHPRTHGWVAAVASEMHATLGEHTACMSVLDIAAEQLSRPMPSEPWKGIGAFSAAKLTAYRGGDLMRLGRYREAETQLRIALDMLDPALAKHRCTAHIDLATAYAADGEPAEAARHAISALEIIEFTRHADSLRRVSGLYRQVRSSGTAAVRDLGSKLMAVRAAS